MILGEIKRFLRDDGLIKVSRPIKELAVKAKQLEEEITKKSQSIYTREEADYFKQINKFSVKYKGKSAVISQIPEQTKSDSSF